MQPGMNPAWISTDPLLTDLYQLTMAFGYFEKGMREHESVFHLFFRSNPFGGGFTVACGLHRVIELLREFHFQKAHLEYLRDLKGADGRPLFSNEFLEFLRCLDLDVDMDAVPEGSVVFPHEPLLRVQGPLISCQLLETALLNALNFESLIATKAARICWAAQNDPVIEFGLRRAHGADGALSASRAAYVGGCSGTSNVLAGMKFGIPVKGTHAHSWVMCFESELDAFQAYADALPAQCTFLVDTYNSMQGIDHAIKVGLTLREKGHRALGIRLDSGDLLSLSREARKRLNDAGLQQCTIIASNDLDEYAIESLKRNGAAIDAWGVGTRLATAYDQPALGGVYKLAAIRPPGQEWAYRMKHSDDPAKSTWPGILQARRYLMHGSALADVLFDVASPPARGSHMVDLVQGKRLLPIPGACDQRDLLVPLLRRGILVYQPPELDAIRARVKTQLNALTEGSRRLRYPSKYPVGVEPGLFERRANMRNGS